MSKSKFITGPMRIPFLLLNPACVALGISTAMMAGVRISIPDAVLALIGAVTAHISVNAFNEYSDCKSGLDAKTTRTPFSGGSGVLPENPEMAYMALRTALAAFAVTGLIGIYFALKRGPAIIPLGLMGLVVIIAYTPFLTRMPFLCLIAPGIGFGTLMVMGTHFVLTGQYSLTAFIASMVPFFLVSNLLLLNQFPDVEADRSVGRKTLPIVWGLRRASIVYVLFLAFTYLTIAAAAAFHVLPKWSLIGLATIVFAVPASLGALRHASDTRQLTPSLGMNVAINLATPLLMAVGIIIGR